MSRAGVELRIWDEGLVVKGVRVGCVGLYWCC